MLFSFCSQAPSPTDIYTLSLHDALPICRQVVEEGRCVLLDAGPDQLADGDNPGHVGRLECKDRKSTRLNSSHRTSSYAVFCLKKKEEQNGPHPARKHGCEEGGADSSCGC